MVTFETGALAGGAIVREFDGTRSAIANARGEFGLELAPGRHLLTVEAKSRKDLSRELVEVAVVAGRTASVRPVLRRRAVLSGTVRGGGRAVSGAYVTAVSELDPSKSVTVRTANGAFALALPVEGPYRVLIESASALANEWFPDQAVQSRSRLFNMQSGTKQSIAVNLEVGGAMSGTLAVPASQDPEPPRALIAVFAEGASPDEWPLAAAVAGSTFGMRGLRPGTYRVLVLTEEPYGDQYYRNSLSYRRALPVRVAAGGTSRLRIALTEKPPAMQITRMSKQTFAAGTTTPGVRVFGRGFPLDPDAISFFEVGPPTGPQVRFTVTRVISATEAVVTAVAGPAQSAVTATGKLAGWTLNSGAITSNITISVTASRAVTAAGGAYADDAVPGSDVVTGDGQRPSVPATPRSFDWIEALGGRAAGYISP